MSVWVWGRGPKSHSQPRDVETRAQEFRGVGVPPQMSRSFYTLVSGLFGLSRFGTLCFAGLRKIRGLAPFCRQFGEVGEIRTEPSTRFRQVWRSECIFVVSLGRSGRLGENLARGFGRFGGRSAFCRQFVEVGEIGREPRTRFW